MNRGKIRRILVIRIDFLGDMVCTTPFIHSLKERWPEAEIHVLANKYNSSVLDGNPDVSKVHFYVYSKNLQKNIRSNFLGSLVDRVKLIFRLRMLKFDMVIIPNGGMNKNSINFARQLNVSDCRWHNSDTEFDDRKPCHVNCRPIHHEALSGYKLVPEIDNPAIEQLCLQLYPRERLIKNWDGLLKGRGRKRVGLFVSNKSAARCWPLDKWIAIAQKLSMLNDVIIFYSPDEIVSSAWKSLDRVQCVQPPTISDLIAAQSIINLTISADSAPVHISSALNVPVIALFESRREKYLRWFPLGVKNIVIHEGDTVSEISVESVLLSTDKMLADDRQ